MTALLANTPQVLLSTLYFSINALLTALLLAHEWSSYATKRKGLRVSAIPLCAQRGTYKLQLPFRYSIPFAALSSLLHWLGAQAFFPVALEKMAWLENPDESQGDMVWISGEDLSMGCACSPPAVLCAVICVAVVAVAVLGLGMRKFEGGMPVVGSCSAAMAAACHVREGGLLDMATPWSEVRWGCTGIGEDGVGHCAFSTGKVEDVKEGMNYM